MAADATLHCIAGCAIGEITGLMVGTNESPRACPVRHIQ